MNIREEFEKLENKPAPISVQISSNPTDRNWWIWQAAWEARGEHDADKCKWVAEYQRNNTYHNLDEFENTIRNDKEEK